MFQLSAKISRFSKFLQITIMLLWQIIPWSFQEVTADWMHFSSNSYFNFIHDSLFPQRHMKGLRLSNKLIIFLDVKVERANSQVKELDSRLDYWNFFWGSRIKSQSSFATCEWLSTWLWAVLYIWQHFLLKRYLCQTSRE